MIDVGGRVPGGANKGSPAIGLFRHRQSEKCSSFESFDNCGRRTKDRF